VPTICFAGGGVGHVDATAHAHIGQAVQWSHYLKDADINLTFPAGALDAMEGAAMVAELEAGGTGIVGTVNLHGITTQD